MKVIIKVLIQPSKPVKPKAFWREGRHDKNVDRCVKIDEDDKGNGKITKLDSKGLNMIANMERDLSTIKYNKTTRQITNVTYNAPLTQDQFNALVSLRYNIGSLGVVDDLLDYLEKGSYNRS